MGRWFWQRLLGTGFSLFFWIFNATLLLVALICWVLIGPELMVDFARGQLPWDFMVPFLGFVGAPAIASVVRFRQRQKTSLRLFHLFYGIELPLIILGLVRFFMLRQLVPATGFMLVSLLLGMSAYGYLLWLQDRSPSPWQRRLQGLSQGFLLIPGVYLLAFASFYILPTLGAIAMHFQEILVTLPFLLPVSPFILLFFGLLSMPLGTGGLYLYRWSQYWHSQAQPGYRHLGYRYLGGTGIVVAVWLSLFWGLQQQPHIQAFQLLEHPPQNQGEQVARLGQADLIRRGLLNAYLIPYRYLGVAGSDRTIYYLYRDNFNVSEGASLTLQHLHDQLLSPFLAQGLPFDSGDRRGLFGHTQEAAALYASFFDRPILRAEEQAITAALESTFDRRSAKASLADINQEKVLLANQDVTLKTEGDWAEITIHEVYQNQTTEPLEILYYFTLPESAVITGLWLGDTANLGDRYVYQISPRGAAQRVYANQVVRQVDPALLEQVGPGNYRLRAFPIPPREPVMSTRRMELETGDRPREMHLWLSYRTLGTAAGWPLPQLKERRNIYWNRQTQRNLSPPKDQWFAQTIPDDLPHGLLPQNHRIQLTDTVAIAATPLPEGPPTLPKNKTPENKTFALIVDTSLSMQEQRTALDREWQWLAEHLGGHNRFDLYLTQAAAMEPVRQNDISLADPPLGNSPFYGSLQPMEMIQQFLDLRQNQAYDAIFLLSDGTTYELSQNLDQPLAVEAPLWFVSLGGLPIAFDDSSQEMLQNSGGGATTTLEEAVQRWQVQAAPSPANVVNINWVDGYLWQWINLNAAVPSPSPQDVNQGFMPLAARQWVQYLGQHQQAQTPAQLDTIHDLAQTYSMVTPYSSMIVLVNDQQRQELAAAEEQGDRFDRAIEDQQPLQSPSLEQANADLAPDSIISGVPEPPLVILIGAAIGLAIGGIASKR